MGLILPITVNGTQLLGTPAYQKGLIEDTVDLGEGDHQICLTFTAADDKRGLGPTKITSEGITCLLMTRVLPYKLAASFLVPEFPEV